MPAVYSSRSMAEFFEKCGIGSPACNTEVLDRMYTVEYDPLQKKNKFMSLKDVGQLYYELDQRNKLRKHVHEPRLRFDENAQKDEGITKADAMANVNYGHYSPASVLEYTLTKRIEEGNLFVYASGDNSPYPKTVRGPKVSTDEVLHGDHLTIRKAEFSFDENKARNIKVEKPHMPLGRYLLSFFGGYKEERAEYDKKFKEYSYNKALQEGVAELSAEREKQIEIEKNDPDLAKRKEILREAEEIHDKFKEKIAGKDLPGVMSEAVVTLDNGDGWPDSATREAEYLRRTSPDYQEKYQALKNSEIVRAVSEKLIKSEARLITTDKLTASVVSPEAYLELTQGSNKSPKEATAEYQKYYSAIENLHFNTKPDNRKQDVEFLTNLCKENIDTVSKTHQVLGYDHEYTKSKKQNQLSSVDAVGAATNQNVFSKFIADNNHRILLTRELLNQMELKGNAGIRYDQEKVKCDIIARCCENLDKQLHSGGERGRWQYSACATFDENTSKISKKNAGKSRENLEFKNRILTCHTKMGVAYLAATQIANGMERPQGVSAETVAQAIAQSENGKKCFDAFVEKLSTLGRSNLDDDMKDKKLGADIMKFMKESTVNILDDKKEKAPAEQTKEKAEPVATAAKEKSEPTSEKQADGKQADQKQKQTAKSKAM